MQCPHCKEEPLQISATIQIEGSGEINERGVLLITEIGKDGQILELSCAGCGETIDLEYLIAWDFAKEILNEHTPKRPGN